MKATVAGVSKGGASAKVGVAISAANRGAATMVFMGMRLGSVRWRGGRSVGDHASIAIAALGGAVTGAFRRGRIGKRAELDQPVFARALGVAAELGGERLG